MRRGGMVVRVEVGRTKGDVEVLEAFCNLLERIPERDPRTFFAFEPAVVTEIFASGETICSLAFADGEVSPIAGGFIWGPSASDPDELKAEHEGGDVGFVPGTYLQIDNTIVDPTHRGQRLQAHIIEHLVEGATEPIVATVSPENPASLKNLLSCGFEIRKTVERHGGFKRHVIVREPS